MTLSLIYSFILRLNLKTVTYLSHIPPGIALKRCKKKKNKKTKKTRTIKMADSENLRRLFCGISFTGPYSLWFFVIANIFLAITSTLGNTLILAALNKELSLHPPSKMLLRSLALTDFCVGILLEPIFVMFLMTKDWDLCVIFVVVSVLFSILSLFTLTAISVDRLLALLLGITYKQVVTITRAVVAVISFWSLNISFAMSAFLNIRVVAYYSIIVVLLCLLISTCCYFKIYRKLLHHHAQIQGHIHHGQPNGHAPLNIARYRKTVSTALWVHFTLVTCYLPTVIGSGLLIAGLDKTPALILAWKLSLTLTFFNSTLNPILYCWKITEVRRAVIAIVRQLCFVSD